MQSGSVPGVNEVFYRPQRSWAKVIFLHLSVILLTGGVWSQGGLQFWGSPIFRGVSNFLRGLEFLGGLQFWGGSPNFFFFFFQFFSPKTILLGCTNPNPPPPQPPRWSMHGRYASYWNAFLCNFVFEFASLDDKYEKLE